MNEHIALAYVLACVAPGFMPLVGSMLFHWREDASAVRIAYAKSAALSLVGTAALGLWYFKRSLGRTHGLRP